MKATQSEDLQKRCQAVKLTRSGWTPIESCVINAPLRFSFLTGHFSKWLLRRCKSAIRAEELSPSIDVLLHDSSYIFKGKVQALHTRGSYTAFACIDRDGGWGTSCNCPTGLRTSPPCRHTATLMLLVCKFTDAEAYHSFVDYKRHIPTLKQRAAAIKTDADLLREMPPVVKAKLAEVVKKHKTDYQDRQAAKKKSLVYSSSEFDVNDSLNSLLISD